MTIARTALLALAPAFLSLAACQPQAMQLTPLPDGGTCASGDVPVYANRFQPLEGGSGVATPADAMAGKANSSSGSTGGGFSTGGTSTGGTSTGGSGPSGVPTPTDGSGADLTAMVVSCAPVDCAPGQVAVEQPPPVSNNGGGGGFGAPVSGAASSGGSSSAGPSAPPSDTTGAPPSDPAAPPTGTPPDPSAPTTPPPGTTYLCVAPPPACPAGESPQYTLKGEWVCTDCSVVVTYGGIYGNYRRCVGLPKIQCATGQVPTWVYEDEQWECKDTCNNGQYDQHSIGDTVVCVPC